MESHLSLRRQARKEKLGGGVDERASSASTLQSRREEAAQAEVYSAAGRQGAGTAERHPFNGGGGQGWKREGEGGRREAWLTPPLKASTLSRFFLSSEEESPLAGGGWGSLCSRGRPTPAGRCTPRRPSACPMAPGGGPQRLAASQARQSCSTGPWPRLLLKSIFLYLRQ